MFNICRLCVVFRLGYRTRLPGGRWVDCVLYSNGKVKRVNVSASLKRIIIIINFSFGHTNVMELLGLCKQRFVFLSGLVV